MAGRDERGGQRGEQRGERGERRDGTDAPGGRGTDGLHPAVRRAAGPRHGGTRTLDWRAPAGEPLTAPPPSSPDAPPRKDKIHSVLTALPILMLVIGLYFHHRGESAQRIGAPILAESVAVRGTFDRLSGSGERHYLWFDDGTRVRGARLRPVQRDALRGLVPGDELRLRLAPTVAGSSTLWAWRVERDGKVLVDEAGQLR